MYKPILILLVCLGVTSSSLAQRSDHTASIRDVTGEEYLRIHYDNDFLTKTDYYYTQGYSLELVTPALKKNPVSKLLPELNAGRIKYGLAFEHFGFTPTSIKSDVILIGDRPFAGVIMLKSFKTSVDTIRKQRLVSILSLGMIGPAAFAGKMQTAIHRWTGDPEPRGWQYQIRNNPVINYEISYEKELLDLPDIISIHTNTRVRLGTLSDQLQAGISLTLGRFDSSFGRSEKSYSKNYRVYLYSQPSVALVGYDASLQGGFINKKSVYTMKSTEIKRIVFQNNFGIVLHIRKIYVEYYQTYLTKEFNTGREHRWGGIKLGSSI